MSLADLLALGLVAVVGLASFRAGLIGTVLWFATWAGAVAATVHGFGLVLPHAETVVGRGLAADAATAAALFAVSLIALTYARHALAGRVRRSPLGPLDRTLGLAAGIAIAFTALSGAYAAGRHFGVSYDREFYREARSLPLIRQGAEFLMSLAPPAIASAAPAAPPPDAEKRFRTLLEPRTETAGSGNPAGYSSDERRAMDRLFNTHR